LPFFDILPVRKTHFFQKAAYTRPYLYPVARFKPSCIFIPLGNLFVNRQGCFYCHLCRFYYRRRFLLLSSCRKRENSQHDNNKCSELQPITPLCVKSNFFHGSVYDCNSYTKVEHIIP